MSPLEAIQAPQDYMTVNQWLLEIEGVPFATFSNVSGLQRSVGTLTRADGGTGLVYTFPNNQQTFNDLTFTRQRDPDDPTDPEIKSFVDAAIASGTKFAGVLTKFHQGEMQFRVRFTGLLFHTESMPAFDKNSGAGFDQSYSASVDYWEEVPAAA